jgi:hypothetical protein
MWYDVTLAAGIILLLISLPVLKASLRFLRVSKRATATVIELERISSSDGDTYKPIFKFETDTLQEIIYTPDSSSTPTIWRVGQKVKIAYDPHNPYSVKVLLFFGMFDWTIILIIAAVLLIIIGGGYHLYALICR